MGKVTVYKAKDGWRWHRQVSSDMVSESGEGYEAKAHAVDQAKIAGEPGDTLEIQHVQADGSIQTTQTVLADPEAPDAA